MAGWRAATTRRTSIAYNQGITFNPARGNFFFDGVTSMTNSGLYRTDARLRQLAANTAVIPKTREGYNHAGDLSFDLIKRRILLPLECYYPNSGGNTCGTGAIGVVDPVTLRFRYYVNLARSQIKKAMWDEIRLDGRWIWTSSGTHLLAYRATHITFAVARRQRTGKSSGIIGLDLGSVLPTQRRNHRHVLSRSSQPDGPSPGLAASRSPLRGHLVLHHHRQWEPEAVELASEHDHHHGPATAGQ